jgi:hypothetical protein
VKLESKICPAVRLLAEERQRAIYNLQKTVSDLYMSISIEKTKIMVFSGKAPVRSKFCINNKMLEQVNTFNYLGLHPAL